MILEGAISISKVTSSNEDYIEISLTDMVARVRFATLKLSLQDFAHALMNRYEVRGELETRGINLIGTRHEHKEEVVLCGRVISDRDKKAAIQVMKTFEVDGWEGREEDLWNHHRWVEGGSRVSFFRHVPRPESERELFLAELGK